MIKTAFKDKRLQHDQDFSVKPLALAISVILLGATHNAAHAGPGMTELGTFAADNAGISAAYGVSGTGGVVVGEAYTGTVYRAFLWSQATGRMTSLGTLPGGEAKGSTASGVNAAGNVVVGTAHNGTDFHAFRWTQATGMTDLGTPAGANASFGQSVNAAGDVVVGWVRGPIDDPFLFDVAEYAFRWTPTHGMTDLGTFAGGRVGRSGAYGVNAAGDVVVGKALTATDAHAFRWTEATGMVDLGTLAADKKEGYSGANGVNAAGDVVVGHAYNGITTRAFRWTEATGMTDLGIFAGRGDDTYTVAYDVNASGNVAVGYSWIDGSSRAFRWALNPGSATEGTMQTIEDWLASHGVSVTPSASKASHARGVNASGDVVVGKLDNDHAFIATTKGLIDQIENDKSLAGSAGVPARAMQDASLVMHGAHGSPMRGLLGEGKQSVWTAGDWGHTDNRGNDGNLGSVEFGYARGVSNQVMVKLALGRTYSKQDTVFGGRTKMDGTYLMPEVIAKIAETPLHASFSAYYNWGDAEITRGYANAGTREYARGSADTSTAAVRARLDWLDAVKAGNTAFTPYTSVTYTRTKIDAYTEAGGAFPARWNSRSEHATEARLGVDLAHRVSDKLDVLGRLEGVHRFSDTGATARGDVAGLYGFSLPGQTYKRNWLRTTVGVEGKFGAGTGSLTLNVSNQGDATMHWLAASYSVDF